MTRRALKNMPDSMEVWEGMAGHFDDFFQVMAEFVDNSIANLEENELDVSQIQITFEEKADNFVDVTIEDTGTGITYERMDGALRLGARPESESVRNEHGFGMKHALSSANKNNDSWKIATKTNSDISRQMYRVISAPYSFTNLYEDEVNSSHEPWPGKFTNLTGTFINFKCPKELFDTLKQRTATRFSTLTQYFVELLGYQYSHIISRAGIGMKVKGIDLSGHEEKHTVKAIVPKWSWKTTEPVPGSQDVDLGNGNIKINYEFGKIDVDANLKVCYLVSTADMGVEIRINGRKIEDRLFEQIWDLARNPSYNHFRGIIDLQSDDREKLPPTLTNKTGFQETRMYTKLKNWIKETLPNPPKETTQDMGENDLRDQLKENLNTYIPGEKTVSSEIYAYEGLNAGIRIDLYVKHSGGIEIYECKKNQTKVGDLYQLMMYWDGLVYTDSTPTKGKLVASTHPSHVEAAVDYINTLKDKQGNNYNFELKTWREEGISFPV